MRPNRLQILMVFAVGVLFGGVRGDCGGFGPDLSNLEKSGSLVVHVDDQNGVPVNGVEVQICCNGSLDITIGEVSTGVTGPILGLETGGEVFFLLLEGTYTMTVNPPNEFRVPAPRTVEVKRDHDTRVVVKLELAGLSSKSF